MSVVDRCRVPVIAAIQGGCIGGGVDLITACDMRVGSADAFFTIQEVNIAIVADVGTLQRIPYLLPQGLVRELAYTGRRFPATEALRYGFLNSVHPDHDAALAAARFSFGPDIDVSTEISKRWVTVTSTYELDTDLPMVGRLVPDIQLSSHFSMLLEPPID
jgi:1,4-dihydroxy-2-naphthoyl-CoA synthase